MDAFRIGSLLEMGVATGVASLTLTRARPLRPIRQWGRAGRLSLLHQPLGCCRSGGLALAGALQRHSGMADGSGNCSSLSSTGLPFNHHHPAGTKRGVSPNHPFEGSITSA